MSKKDEALKLALERAQPSFMTPGWTLVRNEDITAIRKALAEQPAQQQEPVAWINWCAATGKRSVSFECESELASQPLYEGITQNTQYHYSKFHSWFDSELHRQKYTQDHPAYLAAQEAWNAANDAAQHRINRLNAEIEAWKVRFKIAEDALAKLNGPEQKPVATMWQHGETGRTRITMPGDITDCDARWFKAADLYTSPPAQQEPVSTIRALTNQCAALIQERDELQKQVWRYEKNGVTCQTYRHKVDASCSECNVHEVYTSPPASKPWVGLTDEEIEKGRGQTFSINNPYCPCDSKTMRKAVRWAEAKLREKNA